MHTVSHRGEKKDSNMEMLGGTAVAFPINHAGGLSEEAACELKLEEVRAQKEVNSLRRKKELQVQRPRPGMDWTLPVIGGALGVGASKVSPQLGMVLAAQIGICIQVPVSYGKELDMDT